MMFLRSIPLRELTHLPRVQPILCFHVAIPFNFATTRVLLILYCAICCSSVRSVLQIPVNMQSASIHAVGNAFAIRLLIRRCTRMYFCLLCSKFIASFNTGPHVSRGRIAPLYVFAIASHLIPHDNFAAFYKLCISFSLLSAA